jgi:hypothetical protein
VGKENFDRNVWANIWIWLLDNKIESKIYNKFKSPDTITVIEVSRLEWLGDVARLDGERAVRKLLEVKQGGGRKMEDLD